MGSQDDIDALKADIAELRALVNSQRGLSAEARVTALSAMIRAKATVLAVETVQAYSESIRHDTVKPLMGAIDEFGGSAARLEKALRRLPER